MSARVVEVRPPKAQREGLIVLGVAAGITLLSGAHIALFSAPHAQVAKRTGEVLFIDLRFEQQRAFRELQEGLLEAERLRSDKGHWPTVQELSAEQIPPFAAGGWHSIETNQGLNYTGKAGETTFLALIQEPGEWAAPGSVKLDEDHRQLRDGEMLHVSIWLSESTGPLDRLILDPRSSGFTRIRIAPSPKEAP